LPHGCNICGGIRGLVLSGGDYAGGWSRHFRNYVVAEEYEVERAGFDHQLRYTMCDQHDFQFDVDQAYEQQLLSVLESSPMHPLQDPDASPLPGVYALYRGAQEAPVYIGEALSASGIRGRLREHRRKIEGRQGISIGEMKCRYLTIERSWEVARAESVLIENYRPEWNGIPGFSMHVAGRGRPGMPGYVNEWDRKFPVLA